MVLFFTITIKLYLLDLVSNCLNNLTVVFFLIMNTCNNLWGDNSIGLLKVTLS